MLFNNPIDLVIGGKVQAFDTLRDFYLKVLQILRSEFPRGNIDYKVFLFDHTTLRGDSLSACCKFIERGMDGSDDYCISVHWTYGVQTRDKLSVLLRKMSKQSTGSCFVIQEFDAAWKLFHQSIIQNE